MILQSILTLLPSLFITTSYADTGMGAPMPYQDYLELSYVADNSFSDTYVQSDELVSFYCPVIWERTTTIRYAMFYVDLSNAQDGSDLYFVGGFGYDPSAFGNAYLRFYIPAANSKYISNLQLSLSVFANTFTPYETNDHVANTSFNYSQQGHSSQGWYKQSNPIINLFQVDDETFGFGAIMTFNISYYNSDTTAVYDQGYDDGYAKGYNDGNASGIDTGYLDGLAQGQEDGYRQGYEDGARSGNTSIMSIMGAIVDTPILIMRSLFDYQLFGSSIYVVLLSLLTFIVVIWLFRKFV